MAVTQDFHRDNHNNRTPSEVAAEYKGRGWKPVPVPAGEKGPRDPDWQTRNYDP
jgi:hypothetical protein